MNLVEPTPITLDKPRTLLYTFNAYRVAEIELTKLWGTRTTIPGVLAAIYQNDTPGTSHMQAAEQSTEVPAATMSVLSNKISIAEVLIILWAGLLHEDKKLTLDYLGDNLFFNDLGSVLGPIITAVSASRPSSITEEGTSKEDPFLQQTP